jgi:hypothetical protein
VEWLWVAIIGVIILGPLVWVLVRERQSTGAPAREDQLNQTGVGGELRNSVGRGPGTYLPRKPDGR